MAEALKARNKSSAPLMAHLQRFRRRTASFPGALPQAFALRVFGARRERHPSHSSAVRVLSGLVILSVSFIAGSSTDFNSSVPSAKRTLRVMTYNIHIGIGMDKTTDLKRLAGVINHEHPDLVGLQEVDRGVERTQRVDEIAEIAKLTRMEYAFAYNLHYQGGQYGVAILSRFPIMAIDHRRYGNTREKERRGMIRVEVA